MITIISSRQLNEGVAIEFSEALSLSKGQLIQIGRMVFRHNGGDIFQLVQGVQDDMVDMPVSFMPDELLEFIDHSVNDGKVYYTFAVKDFTVTIEKEWRDFVSFGHYPTGDYTIYCTSSAYPGYYKVKLAID